MPAKSKPISKQVWSCEKTGLTLDCIAWHHFSVCVSTASVWGISGALLCLSVFVQGSGSGQRLSGPVAGAATRMGGRSELTEAQRMYACIHTVRVNHGTTNQSKIISLTHTWTNTQSGFTLVFSSLSLAAVSVRAVSISPPLLTYSGALVGFEGCVCVRAVEQEAIVVIWKESWQNNSRRMYRSKRQWEELSQVK